MADRGQVLLTGRVKRMELILGRKLETASPSTQLLPEKDEAYLLETAQEFYWNDLEWEKLTGEEKIDEEFLTELAFPGFLAFVRGLLLEEVQPDSPVPAHPRPEVVDGVLEFLSGRVVELEEDAASTEGEDHDHREAELQMTSRLVDLVLYLHHRLDPEEVNRVEASLAAR